MTNERFKQLKNHVFHTMSFTEDNSFEFTESEDVYVKSTRGKVFIGGAEKADIARAFLLYIKERRAGRTNFEVRQKRRFKELGIYFDVSRGGVLRVSALKQYMNEMLCLGYNQMFLYMEDVFELPGYPHFGYQRGRYSKEELKEISDYGDEIGIEVIPSIQTLGHMGQYLQWKEAEAFRDTNSILLCESQKTYDFIEAMLRTLREAFSTRRIHIGCDEAHGLGTGNYLTNNGYRKPLDILKTHMRKVFELCRKYEFTPIIYADSFFRNISRKHLYYDMELNLSKYNWEGLQDFDIVYWDYYHLEEKVYDTMIKHHKDFKGTPMFLGGIWTFCGYLPNVQHTLDTMIPAMKSCLKNGINQVSAAMFGDDGTECSYRMAFPLITIFSEYCFRGEECTFEDINEMSLLLYEVDLSRYKEISHFYYPFVEGLPMTRQAHPNCMGMKILTADIFYNSVGITDFVKILPRHQRGYRETLFAGRGTKWEKYYAFSNIVFSITVNKIKVLSGLQKAYRKEDKLFLKNILEHELPEIVKKYHEMYRLHEDLWMETYKAFGWEEMQSRYATMIFRTEYAIKIIGEYINGEQDKIGELEYELIEDLYGNHYYSGFNRFQGSKTASVPM